MHTAAVSLDNSNTLKFVKKYWHTATSVVALLLSAGMSVGLVRGKNSGVESRVDAVERTHPDATSALTQRNADELSAMRNQLGQVARDVTDMRVDLTRLCTRFDLQPIRAADAAADPRAIAR
jgi:hypothetical protein